MLLNYDFRLIDISMELFALEDHLALIEKQMKRLQKSKQYISKNSIQRQKLTQEDPEYGEAVRDCDEYCDLFLPRVFSGSFLVALYAVFETSVTEIAKLLQTHRNILISINDLKKDFPERSKNYFEAILQFSLCNDNNSWQRIKMLSELRNGIAHCNGRFEMINSSSQQKIRKWEKQKIGIEILNGYLVIKIDFARDTFNIVRKSIEELVARYKKWHSEWKAK